MKTWQDFSGETGAATTTWYYHATRGWLYAKRYNDGNGPDYTYTAGGRLKTRSWARSSGGNRVLTTYTYGFDDGTGNNEHGDLVGVAYSNDPENTPSATFAYDRSGRRQTVVRDSMTTTLRYNDASQWLSESYSGGLLDGVTVTNQFDSYARRSNLGLVQGQQQTLLYSVDYDYDVAGRLETVTAGSLTATYSYLANSPLVEQIDFRRGETLAMTTTKQFDLDGNLTQDDRWDYAWDLAREIAICWRAGDSRMTFLQRMQVNGGKSTISRAEENRLVRMVTRSGVTPARRLEFAYDYQGRRIRKRVWDNTAGTGNPIWELRFVYDRWNLISILSSALSPQSSFVWGLDLSGSEQGAGGVGGLLMFYNPTFGWCFAAPDGNGNVLALVDEEGNLGARYEYGPFGELHFGANTLELANPFRFSTKFQDDETGFMYYGYRYYDPDTGRWQNSDPVEEEGGINLYNFTANDPCNNYDNLGLANGNPPPNVTLTLVDLEYRSEGFAFRDYKWTSYGPKDESGKQMTTAAWYSQTVLPMKSQVCNSGVLIAENLQKKTDAYPLFSTSYVKSTVSNNGRCCAKLAATCHVTYKVLYWGEIYPKRFKTTGTILGEFLPSWATTMGKPVNSYTKLPSTAGKYNGFVSFNQRVQKEIQVKSKTTFTLYEVYTPVVLWTGGWFSGGFHEESQGVCNVSTHAKITSGLSWEAVCSSTRAGSGAGDSPGCAFGRRRL